MKIKVLTILLFAMFMVSCSTIKHTASTADIDNKVVTFTVANLDVNPKKVEKTYSWSYNPFIRVSVSNVKENVTAELVKESNADVLLEPQYIVHKGGLFRGGSVTVIGIPASYKNFHEMTVEEAAIVRDAFSNNKKETKKRWFFF